jgi:opacity protein-like surface antigen
MFPASLFAQQDISTEGFRDYPSPTGQSPASTASHSDAASNNPKIDAQIPYRTSASLRGPDGTGMNIGLFGGAIAFQDGTLNITSGAVPGVQVNGDTKSRLGGVAGIRFGYTWPHFLNDPNTNATGPDFLMPAVEEEFFWTGYNYKATDASFGTGSSLTADVNTLNFMVDPKLKFRIGAFRPYIGFGVGATYVDVGNAKLNIPGLGTGQLTGSSDDIDFSVQGLAGCEVFVAHNWAFSLDYKYQYIVDPTFHGTFPGADVKYHLDGLGGHLFTAGLNYYF